MKLTSRYTKVTPFEHGRMTIGPIISDDVDEFIDIVIKSGLSFGFDKKFPEILAKEFMRNGQKLYECTYITTGPEVTTLLTPDGTPIDEDDFESLLGKLRYPQSDYCYMKWEALHGRTEHGEAFVVNRDEHTGCFDTRRLSCATVTTGSFSKDDFKTLIRSMSDKKIYLLDDAAAKDDTKTQGVDTTKVSDLSAYRRRKTG